MEKQRNNLEVNEKGDFLKDSYFVGDSLSVGITNSYKNFDGSVKGGMQTSWMLEQVKNNISKIKEKEVMFLLGGTNDVFSNKSSAQIIKNIDAIVALAEQNGVKVVVGTIPPFTEDKKVVQKALKKLNTSADKLQKTISEVNSHIKSKYKFIDFHTIVADPAKPNQINPKYEGKGNAGDGIHMFNAYGIMGEAQKQKFSEIVGNKNEKKISNQNDFEKYFSENISKQKWFLELSLEKQTEMKTLYKQKFDIEKKLISYNSKKEISNIESTDTFGKMDYNDKVEMIEREIDMLERELYNVELAIAQPELDKDATVRYGNFDTDMKSSDYKKMADYIEGKHLKDITAGELYTIKLMGYDLSKLFLKGNGQTSKETMKVGDTFTVNFGFNKNLNKNIGIGDLLPIDRFDKIKVNGVLGTRRDSPRPGYYTEKGQYLSVYDNYKVELISEKKYSKEDENNYTKAFQDRRVEIRTPELVERVYNFSGKDIDLKGLAKDEFEIVLAYVNKYSKNESLNLNIDQQNQKISTRDGKNLGDVLNTTRTKELGRNYLKYEKQIDKVIAKYPQIGKENLIRLINHENRGWDPLIKAKGSSAYGLGQMIDSTWSKFGKGMDRNNPEHQLEATCKYLEYLMKNKKCSINEALAYYNTGEGIKNISEKTLNNFYRLNAPIVNKIPSGTPRSREAYFTGAVAYYNDLTYEQAKQIIGGKNA